MQCQFDAVDQVLLRQAEDARNTLDLVHPEPKEGDILVYRDGTEARVANVYKDSVQPALWVGSFFVYRSGWMSYSGALTNSIPLDKLKCGGGRKLAPVWFFHHEQTGAGRGVYSEMLVRTWSCDLPTAPPRKIT